MSECPHKQLKKQMVGEQVWYMCEARECGQKFRVEPWDGRVRLVEGLKVEAGQVLNGELFEAIQTVCAWEQDYRTRNNLGPKPPDCFIRLATLAAQHLKREQEPAPRKWYEYIGKDGRSHWRVTGGNCGCGWTIINDFEWNQHLNREGAERKAQPREQEPAPRPTMEEMGMGDLAWSLAACALKEKWSDAKLGPAIAKFAMDWHAERAAQPPQELVSLVAKWREEADASPAGVSLLRCAMELERAALTRGAVGPKGSENICPICYHHFTDCDCPETLRRRAAREPK